MAEIKLRQLTKVYGRKGAEVRALDELNLDIGRREILALVGPSGCGKTTALRLIAGLDRPTRGTVELHGRDVTALSPKDRDLAMVFQNYALYPHMSVFENIAFGLKSRGIDRTEVGSRVRRVAEMLQLVDLLGRRPRDISGGQMQRVALARAIVRKPAAFLLDEPLSNLDAKMRVEMRAELKTLLRSLDRTAIYVTHDQEEAMSLGDRIAVMQAGKLVQVGSPGAVYTKPVNRFVAGFIGNPPMNFLPARVRQVMGQSVLEFSGGEIPAPTWLPRNSDLADVMVVVGIRPQALSFGDGQAHASIRARIELVEDLGSIRDVHVVVSDTHRLVAQVPSDQRADEGQTVVLLIDVNRLMLFEPGPRGRNVMYDRVEALN